MLFLLKHLLCKFQRKSYLLSRENPIVNVPAQDAENAAPAVPEVEAPEKEKNEEIADEEKKTVFL